MLTLANLICGALAVCEILTGGGYTYVFMLIILAAVFDFFDGFVARFLKQSSAIGAELDSLADIVSFGLAPSLVMMALFHDSVKMCECDLWLRFGGYVPLIIVAFSALRLAKFNIDESQTSEFVGLPTPASALFCASLGMLATKGFVLSGELVVALSVVMALLLILPIRMFALKFKGFAWRGNEVRYCFIALSVALIGALQLDAIAIIILLYIAISCVLHVVGCMGSRGCLSSKPRE